MRLHLQLRSAALGAFLVLLAGASHGQAPVLERIEIGASGIFEATTRDTVSDPRAATGSISELTNLKLQRATSTIPARLGVRFGFLFTPVGPTRGAQVSVRMVVIYPKRGLDNPDTRQTSFRDEFSVDQKIGVEDYLGYTLENDWELVPGTWTFQIWDGARKLAERSFELVKP